MDATIKIDGLHKRFGETQALDGMTFTVRPGQVTGFIGPNGAGKSTTMRVILGLDAPDAGTARHLGQIGPLPAGLDAQATTGINSLPLTPWQGLGVIALWTAGALLLGALALRFRDA
jgi:ABC-type sugar transport system ATPase subunit